MQQKGAIDKIREVSELKRDISHGVPGTDDRKPPRYIVSLSYQNREKSYKFLQRRTNSS